MIYIYHTSRDLRVVQERVNRKCIRLFPNLIRIHFQVTNDFPALWLVKIRRLWSDSHWPVTIAFCFCFKMTARFAVVSGRSNERGKCKNLEKIALRNSIAIWFIKNGRVSIKLYVLYLEKNWFRRRAIHRCVWNLNYVYKLFFAKINTKVKY